MHEEVMLLQPEQIETIVCGARSAIGVLGERAREVSREIDELALKISEKAYSFDHSAQLCNADAAVVSDDGEEAPRP